MSRLREVRRAIEIVDAAPKVAELDEELISRFATKTAIGRPKGISVRTLLVAILAVAFDRRQFHETNVVAEINSWGPSLQQSLGLPRISQIDRRRRGKSREVVTYRQVNFTFDRLADLLDASPVASGRRLPREPKSEEDKALIAAAERGLESEELARRQVSLQRLVDDLLEASVPKDLRTGNYAVDWTDLEVWAQSRKSRRASADRDAGWGRRRPKRNRIGARPRRSSKAEAAADLAAGFESDKNEKFFGLNMHAFVITPTVGGPFVPHLAHRIVITAANMMNVGPLVIDAVDRLAADGVGVGVGVEQLIIDMGYSNKAFENLHKPAAERGVGLVFDIPRNELKATGTFMGAVVSGGELMCPETPVELRTKMPYPGKLGDPAKAQEVRIQVT